LATADCDCVLTSTSQNIVTRMDFKTKTQWRSERGGLPRMALDEGQHFDDK